MLQYDELVTIHINKDQKGIWIVVKKRNCCCLQFSPPKKKLKFTLKKMQVTSTKAISKASNRPLG